MDPLQRNLHSSEGKEQPSLLRSQVYLPHLRSVPDRTVLSRSANGNVQTSRLERMKRFQHHTEQQMQRMSQEPKQVCFSAFGNIDGV